MFHFIDVILPTNISFESPFFRRFHANFKALCHKAIFTKNDLVCNSKIFSNKIFFCLLLFLLAASTNIVQGEKNKYRTKFESHEFWAKRSSMNIIIPRQNRKKHCYYAYARNLIHAYANVFVQIKAESACAISWTNPEKSNNNNYGRSNDSDRSSSSSSSITNAEMTQTHSFA